MESLVGSVYGPLSEGACISSTHIPEAQAQLRRPAWTQVKDETFGHHPTL